MRQHRRIPKPGQDAVIVTIGVREPDPRAHVRTRVQRATCADRSSLAALSTPAL